MAVKKIALFAPITGQYDSMHFFTEGLAKAFTRQGVECRILRSQRDRPAEFIDNLLDNRPDCTLSFNGLLPDEEGRFLADMLKIPHVAYNIDSPNHFFTLSRSQYTIIATIDRDFCDFYHGLHCPYVLFSPHAINQDLAPNAGEKRIYDILMLSTFIDYEAVRNQWKKKYSAAVCSVLEKASEITLSEPRISYIQSFVQSLDQALNQGQPINPIELNLGALFDEIELYVRGKDRIELIKALEDVPVHVIGAGNTTENWKKYLGNQHNRVIVHDPVTYEEALNLMKKSKIVLNSSPTIKNGAHDCIFAGLACGAVVLSTDNIYVKELFADGNGVARYRSNHWNEVNEKIHAFLSNEDERASSALKGREIVMNGHTWDHRATAILKALPAILNKM
jgi:spore maturation protein CgeB